MQIFAQLTAARARLLSPLMLLLFSCQQGVVISEVPAHSSTPKATEAKEAKREFLAKDQIGKWRGVPADGDFSEFIAYYHADGTFSTAFYPKLGSGVPINQEKGRWSVKDGVRKTVTTEVNGESALYIEEYKMVNFDHDHLEYISVRTGNRFTVTRAN